MTEFPVVFASPFMLVAGLALLPPVWTRVLRKFPALVPHSTGVRVLAVLVALPIFGCLVPKPDQRASSYSGSASSASVSSPSSSSPEEDWKKEPNWAMAYTEVEKFVENRLRSPGTAEFPGIFQQHDDVKYLGGQRYQIRSWVDAQNGFGATVRNNFVAEVQQTSENEWRCNSLVIVPRD